jgi:hypothetical protein
MQIGIGLAIVAALMANLASLLKHRGCHRVDPISVRKPLHSVRALATSRWFAAGWGLAAIAWSVNVVALSMAPISLVQAVLAGSAVALAVMAQGLFGDPVERRQWFALLLGGGGLALLVLTVPSFSGSHSGFSPTAILGFEGGLALLAAIAGTLIALAGVAIKGLTGAGGVSVAVLGPWVLLTVLVGVLAQYTAVAALQRGGAIETIGLMGLVANGAQIVGGILVFGDPLSTNPLGLILQVTAFAMVCSSALLIPARAVSARPLATSPA